MSYVTSIAYLVREDIDPRSGKPCWLVERRDGAGDFIPLAIGESDRPRRFPTFRSAEDARESAVRADTAAATRLGLVARQEEDETSDGVVLTVRISKK